MQANELRLAFDRAFASLPEKYRGPAVLCLLEGKSHAEAELGAPRTTISSRLERAPELLQRRLTRRGITLSSTALAALAALVESQSSPAAVPARLFLVRLKTTAAGLLLLTAFGFVGVLTGNAVSEKVSQASANQRPQAAAQAAAVETRPPKSRPSADSLDEPLPEGAVARLGTTRLRHGDSVRAIGFMEGGKALLSADRYRVHVWNAATGRRLRTFGDPFGRQFQDIAFSGDGRTVALSMSDGPIDIWNAATGQRVADFRAGRFPGLLLSPDGKTLVVHDSDWQGKESLRLWDPLTGKERHVLEGHTDRVHCLTFSRDSKVLLSAGDDKSIRFWEVATGKEVRRINHTEAVGTLALSPDGKTLALVSTNKNVFNRPDGQSTAIVWLPEKAVVLIDVASGKTIRRPEGHDQGVHALAFTPDNRTLLAVDNRVHFWNVSSGKKIPNRWLSANWVSVLAFAPDGQTLATGGSDSLLRVWDLATRTEKLAQRGHLGWVRCVAVSRDGRFFATACSDHIVRLWDTRTGKECRRLLGHTDWISALAFAPDSRTLVSSGGDGNRIWDVATGKELRRFEAGSARLTPEGMVVVTAKDGLVRVIDPKSAKELHRWKAAKEELGNLAVSPDGRMLLSLSGEPKKTKSGQTAPDKFSWKVRLADITNGQEIRTFGVRPFEEDERIYCSAFSPDGRYLASGGQMRYLVLYDLATGQKTRRLAGTDSASSLAFAPDSRILASADWSGRAVRLWEVVTGQEFRRFMGHQGRTFGMAFSADGTLLVTGNEDTTALVWDVMGLRKKSIVAHLDTETLAELWKDLGSGDAVRGQRAVATLATHAKEATAFLASRLTPVRAAESKKVVKLIAELEKGNFKVREQAEAELEKLWETAGPAMRQALNGKPSLEGRRRLERLLDSINRPQSVLRLRALRSLQVLETIGSAEAQTLLQDLGAGHRDAWLSLEAKAAVNRLLRRK